MKYHYSSLTEINSEIKTRHFKIQRSLSVLYFNVIYFPFWLSVTIMVMTIKYHLLNYLYKFVLVTVIVAVIIIELVRLYLGYLGNLTEKVPELAGFWLLTILLQLPLQGFLLLNTDLILVPLGKSAPVGKNPSSFQRRGIILIKL